MLAVLILSMLAQSASAQGALAETPPLARAQQSPSPQHESLLPAVDAEAFRRWFIAARSRAKSTRKERGPMGPDPRRQQRPGLRARRNIRGAFRRRRRYEAACRVARIPESSARRLCNVLVRYTYLCRAARTAQVFVMARNSWTCADGVKYHALGHPRSARYRGGRERVEPDT